MKEKSKIDCLLDWFKKSGGIIDDLDIVYINENEGNGMKIRKNMDNKNTRIIKVPSHLLMSKESAKKSIIQKLFIENDLPYDEILSIHLMYEKSIQEKSKWFPFIQTLPTHIDTPIFWNDNELSELEGTNVYLLTKMMKNQIGKDYETILMPLFRKYSYLFEQIDTYFSLESYKWALSIVYSRSFGFNIKTDKQDMEKYIHVLCPVIDMFNHNPKLSLKYNLIDFIDYDEKNKELYFKKSMTQQMDSFLNISYGKYSNAKLLYSYGFVVPENPVLTLDFWLNLPKTDPYYNLKKTLLNSSTLTAEQTYDFNGTIYEDTISEKLLATLRIIHMNQGEIALRHKAFSCSIISVRNELLVYDSLIKSLQAKIAAFKTTIEEDTEILKNITLKNRYRNAIIVRLDDKKLILNAIRTLIYWKNILLNNNQSYPPKDADKCSMNRF